VRAAQWREQEWAAHKKERGIRHLEQRDEEFRLREQQGLPPPVTSEYSSSKEEEEEESDGGQAPLERWEPAPPSLRAAEAAEDQAPRAGAKAPAAGRSTEEAAHTAEVLAHAAEASGSTTVATSAVASAPVEPSRRSKRGFSTLR
jgi:hypothetical protein